MKPFVVDTSRQVRKSRIRGQSNLRPLQRIFGLKMNLPLAAAAMYCLRHFENIISRLVQIDVALDHLAERKYTRGSGDLLPDCGPR